MWAMSPSARRTASARFETIAVRRGSILGIPMRRPSSGTATQISNELSHVGMSLSVGHVTLLDLHRNVSDAEDPHRIMHMLQNVLLS